MSPFSIFLLFINVMTSLKDNAAFIRSVCDQTSAMYDACSCHLANYSISLNDDNLNDLTCFTQFNCPYSAETHEFCSGNGECNFKEGTCECNREYGSFDCSQQFVYFHPSSAILGIMIVSASLLLIISICLMIWVNIHREVSDVKAMSIIFTQLSLFGCALICAGTIVLGIGYDNTNCMLLEWFQFIGICMVIGCALLKAYRISSIFGQSNFSPSDLTDKLLLTYFVIIMVIDIVLLIVYTVFNFIEGGAYDRYLEETLYKETRCSSEPLTMVSYSLLVFWQLVLLLMVIKYGNETRSASEIFKETKCIYIGSNIGSIFFIAFGIFVLFTTNYTLQIAIRGYGSLIVVTMVIVLLFVPKCRAVHASKQVHGMENKKMSHLKRQYEASVKDPNGKELLLLLDVLLKEITYRNDHHMISIEMDSIHLQQCVELLEKVKALIPHKMDDKSKHKLVKQISLEPPPVHKKESVGSDSANIESSTENMVTPTPDTTDRLVSFP